MKLLPNLYPIRFILASLVVLYHIPAISKGFGLPTFDIYPIFHKGTLAVFYFFTLSGFLIIRLIHLEFINTGTFSFKTFYLRRIQRLYPVYYLVFFIGLLLYHVVLPKAGIEFNTDYSIKELVLYYIFLIPNIFKFYYPDVGSILLVLWSIGIEEQFYLFIPPLLYVGRKKIFTTLSIIFLLMIILLLIRPEFYQYANYFFFFIFGGACAVGCEMKTLKIFNNKLIHLIIYLLVIISFTTDIFETHHGNWTLLFHCIISGIFFLLISYYPIFQIKSKIFIRLGKISYGIYMYHMVVITGLLFVVNKLNLAEFIPGWSFIIIFNIITFILTCIVASLSYDYFEKLFYNPRKLK